MFKQHPKGLIVAFFANMGERFGFYTMMAILVLFLQAKYGLSAQIAGSIYSWFYFAIYALALVGGMLADYTNKYKTVILFGQIIMFLGYVLLAVPGLPLGITITGLIIIAFGNGLFKGNLQAVVGQLYDNPKYSKMRDSAFMVFYMGINVGAFFAPFAATGIRNWWLKANGFIHDGSLPSLCHHYINGTLTDTTKLQELANKVNLAGTVTDLSAFTQQYIDVFSRGYNYAFGIAAGALVISLVIYIIFNKLLPNKEKAVAAANANSQPSAAESPLKGAIAVGIALLVGGLIYLISRNIDLSFAFGLFIGFVSWIIQISTKDERPRINALLLVFLVVIFFWMSFHQNGLTLTFFARDYTLKAVDPFTSLFFGISSMLSVIAFIAGIILLLSKNKTNAKIIGAILTISGGALAYYFYKSGSATNAISPEIFQSFNPLFIVALTFPVMGFFAWLNKKGKEPSTPRKIGYGMIIAALGFSIVLIASLNLTAPFELNGMPVADAERVSPYWLMSSYLILTIAELCLSPMGLSFVSKVAPTRFQGLMQGGWLLATAVGNKLLFVGSWAWDRVQLWQLWLIFITCTILSAFFIFSIMKRLEKVAR
jgi:proton-dependent oligopeptide transporter, POT family